MPLVLSISRFLSAGLWSFQPSSWARPWPRGWRQPYFLPQRPANRKITPKLSVKSSNMLLTQRYPCSYLASASQKLNTSLGVVVRTSKWKERNSKNSFLYHPATQAHKHTHTVFFSCCFWLTKPSRCQLSTSDERREGRRGKCALCHISFLSHAAKCRRSKARFNHWSVERCSSLRQDPEAPLAVQICLEKEMERKKEC